MSLTLNAAEARKADNKSMVIRDTGKYICTITRAEKLLSRNNVEGLGLSVKTDDGTSANYLDIYTMKPNGEKLFGFNTVQAILCCLRLKTVDEGHISFQRWDKNEGRLINATAPGYPALMGKRIGLILQKELATHSVTGEDTERLNIFAVFEASTGLVSSEILDGKTKAEKIEVLEKMIAGNPVYDKRKRAQTRQPDTKSALISPSAEPEFDDEIPF